MKWYWFQTYILWPSSIVFYAFIYFMSGIIADGIDVSDIPIDTSNAETFINYYRLIFYTVCCLYTYFISKAV